MKEGFNLIMISRSETKLTEIRKDLISQWPQAEIIIFPWEASLSEESDDHFPQKLDQFIQLCETKSVSILVNNVGTTESTFGWFSDLGYSKDTPNKHVSEIDHVEDLKRTIKTNCLFPSKLTAALLPLLLKHHQRAGVINVSSILAHLPSPFNPIYGATKSFNRAFSRALTAEYAQRGIDVLCVSPGMVTSNLTGLKEATWFCASARDTAKYSLKALGAAVEIFPHPIHGLTFSLVSLSNILLPAKINATFSALALRFLPKPPGINVSRYFRKH